MQKISLSTQFFQLRLIWIALIAGQVLFLLAIVFIAQPPVADLPALPLEWIVPFLSLSTSLISEWVYRKLVGQAVEKPQLADRLASYRTALLIRGALLEFGGLFAMVMFLITQTTWVLAFAALPIAFMVAKVPSLANVESELSLSQSEADQLRA